MSVSNHRGPIDDISAAKKAKRHHLLGIRNYLLDFATSEQTPTRLQLRSQSINEPVKLLDWRGAERPLPDENFLESAERGDDKWKF